MFRAIACTTALMVFAMLAALAAPSLVSAQYYNQGFNSGFSGSNYSSPPSNYYGAPMNAYSPYINTPGAEGQEGSMLAPTGRRAYVSIHSPANATVWFASVRATRKGPDHNFRTLPLTPGEDMRFSVRARWTNKNGVQVERTKTVTLHGGQHATVNLGG